MVSRNYWLDLFTGTTWGEFKAAGGTISGFRESKWTTAQKVKVGDYFLCYLVGVSRFIGVLEVTSTVFKDETPIWGVDAFPCRFKVKILKELTPETAIPIKELGDRLSFFQNMPSPTSWKGHVMSSPAKWTIKDGEAIVQAIEDAWKNPVKRPVDERKLKYRPRIFRAKIGAVIIPEKEDSSEPKEEPEEKRLSEHTEIQYLLLRLGESMGFDLWVARNDKGRSWGGKKFSEISRIKDQLPLQFDEATNRTIELIDVLWLKGKAIVAAFEIESTTSIYSGLLRMSDLVSMQPNLSLPLYLVAPDEKREKVMGEVNRPTFSKLSPPLSEICRFISFTVLKEKINTAGDLLRYLRPEFLEDISESCEIEEV